MGKRFKSGTCAYRGAPGDTADHVFARTFLPEALRGNLRQVAGCAPCNGEKSKLEHYLATILPLGGSQPLSLPMLEQHVPGRLAKNRKLRRELGAGQIPVQ